MQIADLTFNFEIHHGGQFVWNPDLVYLGGSTSFIDEVNPYKFSYFEIQDMCCDLGANSTSRFHYIISGGNLEQGLSLINEDDDVVYMCEIHAAGPTDKITLYVEGGEEPFAVEQPFANEEVADDDDVHEAPQNGDDVHEMHEGGNVDAKEGGQDFDWLEEGFEGLDFDDDVFGNVDDGPSTYDRVSGSVVALHRPSEGDNVNAAPHRPSEGDTVNAAPHRTTPANNDPPLKDGEWIDQLLKMTWKV